MATKLTVLEVREAFETYHVGNMRIRRRNEDGLYIIPCIQDAWEGWKSAYDHYYSIQNSQTGEDNEVK